MSGHGNYRSLEYRAARLNLRVTLATVIANSNFPNKIFNTDLPDLDILLDPVLPVRNTLYISLELKKIGYRRPYKGSKFWIKTPDVPELVYRCLREYHSILAEGVVTSSSRPGKKFKAQYSYDFLIIGPIVLQYLVDHGIPSLISDSIIEDERLSDISVWIDANRKKHCMARVLNQVGYTKRSKRGRAWERVDATPQTINATLSWIYSRKVAEIVAER